jgi:hypothetical protein
MIGQQVFLQRLLVETSALSPSDLAMQMTGLLAMPQLNGFVGPLSHPSCGTFGAQAILENISPDV